MEKLQTWALFLASIAIVWLALSGQPAIKPSLPPAQSPEQATTEAIPTKPDISTPVTAQPKPPPPIIGILPPTQTDIGCWFTHRDQTTQERTILYYGTIADETGDNIHMNINGEILHLSSTSQSNAILWEFENPPYRVTVTPGPENTEESAFGSLTYYEQAQITIEESGAQTHILARGLCSSQ